MSAAAVAAPTIHQPKANSFWRFSFSDRRSSLADDRLPSVQDCVTRRKSADNLRKRNSWRYSWKNALTKPFQSRSTARCGGFRVKNKIRKKLSGTELVEDVSEQSVENRKRMDKLLRLWHAEIIDSSEESSDDDDDLFVRGRRRSCSPRIIGNDSSTSEDEEGEEVMSETPVSRYVSEGPSSMVVLTDQDAAGTESDVSSQGTESRSSSDLRGNSSSIETESGEKLTPVTSNLEALTGSPTLINHGCNNIVIGPVQIYDLERSGDTKLLRHSCSFSRERRADGGIRFLSEPRRTFEANEVFGSGGKIRRVSWLGGQSEHSENVGEYTEQEIYIVRHRLSLPSPRVFCLDDSIEGMRKDRLSVSLQNNHLDLRKEELINESHDEDRSLGEQLGGETTADNQNFTSRTMDDLFTTEDLNAIRRFLGMSLQQIDASKILGNDSMENFHLTATEVSSGDHKESDNEQDVPSAHDKVPAQTNDVVPDYPSTNAKTNEGTQLQICSKNEDESCDFQCDYKDFGCLFPGTRWILELENHMKLNVAEHLNLVSKTAATQKEQLKDQKLLQEKQGNLIRELTETVHNLKHVVQDEMKKNQSHERVVHSLKDQLKEQRRQSQRFERDISHQFQTLSQSTTITTNFPTSPSAAQMLWPIKNFTKLLRQARENAIDDPLISEPFYAGQYGYKLSIWVYVNGRGKNLGTCVSVYARVMPGEHDAILSWPVRPVYTFTLFDQSEGEKENIVRTRKINGIKRDDGKHNGIDRPGGGDRSVIVGFDDFVAHNQLVRRNYLKDDCFFLKLDAKF